MQGRERNQLPCWAWIPGLGLEVLVGILALPLISFALQPSPLTPLSLRCLSVLLHRMVGIQMMPSHAWQVPHP